VQQLCPRRAFFPVLGRALSRELIGKKSWAIQGKTAENHAILENREKFPMFSGSNPDA
jgi:hypothetical protein